MSRNALPVVLYHHVGDARPGTYESLTVTPERFQRQVAWLVRRGYRSLTVEELRRWKHERRRRPARRLLITFDDAYADIADAALPILCAAGLSAVVFVPTGCIGETNRWDSDMEGVHRVMTARQIQEWSERGIEFGAHTRNHVDLTRLAEAEARQEMAGSRADLEAIVDRPVTLFAYPYGHYDPRVVRIAGSIFDLAFTADPGRNDGDTDPYQLKRSMVAPRDAGAEVELRAGLGFSPRERIRVSLHALRHRARPSAKPAS